MRQVLKYLLKKITNREKNLNKLKIGILDGKKDL